MQFKKADITLMALLLIMKSTFIWPYFHFMPIRYGVSFHLWDCCQGKVAEVLEFLKRSQDEPDEEPNRGLFAPTPLLPNRLLAEIVVGEATAIEKKPKLLFVCFTVRTYLLRDVKETFSIAPLGHHENAVELSKLLL